MRPEELRNRKEVRRIFGQVIGAFIHDREFATWPKTSSGGEFAGSPLRPVIGNDKIRGRVVGLLGIVPVVEPQVELVSGGLVGLHRLGVPGTVKSGNVEVKDD